ncbi:Eukaryotic translation initiation factor 5A [Tubulinosema ratisbonensis]|uniref:Eukaryotic translation initiation factor 5A n=1 Tax=Tubulinosema ratisbonensis TaxID=291195 RepID=A0A437AQ66_9MICR|nr:Eukaryotic translation initiation factor 5A [Tubulinosema ratisbonensis]
MAIDLNSPQYEHIPVNSLGKSDILLAENSGRLDYCKVTDISTAKPGKHGSAKFIIKAQNVLNGKGYEVSYVSGTKIVKVKLKRSEYLIVDIFGEEVFTQSTSDDSGDAPIFLKSQFPADDIAQLEDAFMNKESDEVTCILTSAPGLLMIESIRKGGKLLERNK